MRAEDDLTADSLQLECGEVHGHVVQMYEADERPLVHNVGRYLAEGLRRRQSVVIIVGPEHRAAFFAELERLGLDPGAAERDGQLIVLDAAGTLARFMVGGYPDADRFESGVGALVRDLHARGAGLRGYGEMVGMLWQAKEFPAAIRLEQLWEKLRKSIDFDIYCAYPIDPFDHHFQAGVLDALLCSHTRLVPTGPSDGALERAIERAISDMLGSNVSSLEVHAKAKHRAAWPAIPKAEATILWLRVNVPERADAILARAREYYKASA